LIKSEAFYQEISSFRLLVATPCGHTFSRESLIMALSQNSQCPYCHSNLSTYNALTAPINVSISYLVEQARASGVALPPKPTIAWKSKLNILTQNSSRVAKLTIYNIDKKVKFRTLLIPVVDVSGSMSGNPNTQCKYSMCRLVDSTFDNPTLLTHIITYSDRAKSLYVDTNQDREHLKHLINSNNDSGGTNFPSAFSEVVKICEKYKDDDLVSTLSIVFLTDGQDGSGLTREQLVSNLNSDIRSIWKKDFTVHVIGFTNNYDVKFLEGLQKIGTSEGAYKHADPNEDYDTLSRTINSILDVISKTISIPIKLIDSPLKVLNGSNGVYWIEILPHDNIDDIEFTFTLDSIETFKTKPEIENINEQQIWNKWYSMTIDELTSRIMLLSSRESGLDKELMSEIIEQQLRSIQMNLEDTDPTSSRINSLFETLKQIELGETIDIKKLKSLQYEGTYATLLNMNVVMNYN